MTSYEKGFCHDPARWEEFKEKYAEELKSKGEPLLKIKLIEEEKGTITLLYAAKDKEHNNVVALSSVLIRLINSRLSPCFSFPFFL